MHPEPKRHAQKLCDIITSGKVLQQFMQSDKIKTGTCVLHKYVRITQGEERW
jgi:hypothetical protein